jgi:Domain of unknown function (DUF5658)
MPVRNFPLLTLAGALNDVYLHEGAPTVYLVVFAVVIAMNMAALASAEPVDGALSATDPVTLSNVTASPLMSLAPQDPAAGGSHPLLSTVAEPSRSPALVLLYGGFAALQAVDAHSTILASESGRRETNPVLASMSGNAAAIVAVKAAATVGTIWLTEKLWRRNRGAAIGLMIAMNAAYAIVVVRNYRHLR